MSTVYVDTKKAVSVEELRGMEPDISMENNAIVVDYANNDAREASHSRCIRTKPEQRSSSWIDVNDRLPKKPPLTDEQIEVLRDFEHWLWYARKEGENAVDNFLKEREQ